MDLRRRLRLLTPSELEGVARALGFDPSRGPGQGALRAAVEGLLLRNPRARTAMLGFLARAESLARAQRTDEPSGALGSTGALGSAGLDLVAPASGVQSTAEQDPAPPLPDTCSGRAVASEASGSASAASGARVGRSSPERLQARNARLRARLSLLKNERDEARRLEGQAAAALVEVRRVLRETESARAAATEQVARFEAAAVRADVAAAAHHATRLELGERIARLQEEVGSLRAEAVRLRRAGAAASGRPRPAQGVSCASELAAPQGSDERLEVAALRREVAALERRLARLRATTPSAGAWAGRFVRRPLGGVVLAPGRAPVEVCERLRQELGLLDDEAVAVTPWFDGEGRQLCSIDPRPRLEWFGTVVADEAGALFVVSGDDRVGLSPSPGVSPGDVVEARALEGPGLRLAEVARRVDPSELVSTDAGSAAGRAAPLGRRLARRTCAARAPRASRPGTLAAGAPATGARLGRVLVVGGDEVGSSYVKALAGAGIDAQWQSGFSSRVGRAVARVQLVVVILSQVSHEVAREVARVARAAGRPVLRTTARGAGTIAASVAAYLVAAGRSRRT